MSEIEKLFQKLCHVDPVEADTIESHKSIDRADMIEALKEQLKGGIDMGLSQDGIVLNPDDPITPSNLSDGDGFKPVDKCGLA